MAAGGELGGPYGPGCAAGHARLRVLVVLPHPGTVDDDVDAGVAEPRRWSDPGEQQALREGDRARREDDPSVRGGRAHWVLLGSRGRTEGCEMARLPMPELPEWALRELIIELHRRHTRAGWPSSRDPAREIGVSHTTVHALFTRTAAPPKVTSLLDVVERLAVVARRIDVESTLHRFDALWAAAAADMSSV